MADTVSYRQLIRVLQDMIDSGTIGGSDPVVFNGNLVSHICRADNRVMARPRC